MELIEDVVAEMRRLKSKLPPRPSLEDLNYATLTIGKVDNDLSARLDELSKQTRPPGVPYHVFRAYLEMREDLIRHKVYLMLTLLRCARLGSLEFSLVFYPLALSTHLLRPCLSMCIHVALMFVSILHAGPRREAHGSGFQRVRG